jgi:hypothetical protein
MNGVYRIFNKTNDKSYVGSSKWPDYRISHEIEMLKRGQHHNKSLQEDWKSLGQKSFSYEIVDENLDLDSLRKSEQKHIDEYKLVNNCYNANASNKDSQEVFLCLFCGKNTTPDRISKKGKRKFYCSEQCFKAATKHYSGKNVKIREEVHTQIKNISTETGINVGKLIEIGAEKVIEEYKSGKIENLIAVHKQMRRNGMLVRG